MPTETREGEAEREKGIDSAYEVFATNMDSVERVTQDVQAILSPSRESVRLSVASRARTKSVSLSLIHVLISFEYFSLFPSFIVSNSLFGSTFSYLSPVSY